MSKTMTFDNYLQSLPGKLSKVKLLILQTLWEAGDSFPRKWVPSSALLNLTGQKYFDRRIRELRDELGCDVETEYHEGEYCYRLASLKLERYAPRLYLSATQKDQLFKRADYSCQICGKRVPPGIQGLQADHKVPLIRGGSHDESNWQAICNECNVAKRRACAECQDDCKMCPWAFPEKTGSITLIRLPESLSKSIRELGLTGKTEVEKFIIKAIDSFLPKT